VRETRLKHLILILAALATIYVLGACGPSGQSTGDQGDQEEQKESGGGVAAVEPPSNKMMWLMVPQMKRIKYDEIPTGPVRDERLFHDYAGVHIKNTGWPWENVANVYIAGQRLGYKNTNSWLAFWDLDKLEKGDEIYVTDSEGRKYTYVVYRKWIGKEGSSCGARTSNTLSELKPVEGKNIVTLQTCTLPDFKNRLLVRGELKIVSEG
jgi:sortase A